MADTIINKEVNNKTLNNKWVMYLNIISFLLFLLVFYSLFSSIVSFISFIAYFVVLLIGGFGFILMLKKHNYEFSYLIILLISLLVGISLNIILFIFLDYLSIMGFVSLIILFVIGSISLILNNTKAFYVIKRIDIHKDILFTVGMFFLIFSIFLISDFSYYAEDGIYFKDDSHPIYEISISNGLGSMFPVYDMSYSGKIMKYHFGYPIIIHQLTNNFGVDPLTLVYKLIPAMFLFIFILFSPRPA